MNTALATRSRDDINHDHLVALRKVLRDRKIPTKARLLTYTDELTPTEQTSVLRIAEPAAGKHPAGVWEVGLADETTIRVWWMPAASLGDTAVDGTLMAIQHASIVHPLRFAESILDALDDARAQRGCPTWRLPKGM